METLKNFIGMLIIFGGVVAMVAIMYAAHALANSQQLVDVLVSTGHFIDIKTIKKEAAEKEIQIRIDNEVSEKCGIKSE